MNYPPLRNLYRSINTHNPIINSIYLIKTTYHLHSLENCKIETVEIILVSHTLYLERILYVETL